MQDVDFSAKKKARDFMENEKQFHLGFLPTEQSHPKTTGLDETTLKNTRDGIKLMQKVDRDMLSMAERVFESNEFKKLTDSMERSILAGRKVIFSGCGATGRLSILLEACWRKFARENIALKEFENSVFSIMTGGDYALIRSVESFEDYAEFGKRQARDLNISKGDTLVAITEGGETSSVIGTALQAVEAEADVFIAFNNPADLLCKHIERSRLIIEHPETTVLDLHCGPMALAGSTRLQAVTSELLVVGAALEEVAGRAADLKGANISCACRNRPTERFKKLLDELESEKSLDAISRLIEFEESVYSQNGLITYFAENSLLDIFTDTTERAPTFMLPPFVKCDDEASPQSWAFVKSPLNSTIETWERVLQRKPRCLDWKKDDYISLGAPDKIIDNPPRLDKEELYKFRIGNEPDMKRSNVENSAAIALLSVSDAKSGLDDFMGKFKTLKNDFAQSSVVFIGGQIEDASFCVPCDIPDSTLMLWEHLAVKLTMNIVSTLTMARMGRIKSNWMSWVEATNKKLIDRSTRLIAELCEVSYEKACHELFISIDEIMGKSWDNKEKPSPVQHAIDRIKNK